MPFALKSPFAGGAKQGEKRNNPYDDSTPKKAKKAPSAASLVPPRDPFIASGSASSS